MPRRRRDPAGFTTPRQGPSVDTTPTATTLQRAGVNTAVLRRLVELHWRGWLTRAELEAEFGCPYWRLAEIARVAYWRLS